MVKTLYFQCTRGLISVWEIKSHMPCGTAKKKKKEKDINRGFPGVPVVKNPPANAGDTGSIPGAGRSHMRRAAKPESQVTEPVLPSPGLHLPDSRLTATEPHEPCSPSSTTRETPSLRSQHAASRRSPCSATKTQRGRK